MWAGYSVEEPMEKPRNSGEELKLAKPVPWIHTITVILPSVLLVAGTNTFKKRQSSFSEKKTPKKQKKNETKQNKNEKIHISKIRQREFCCKGVTFSFWEDRKYLASFSSWWWWLWWWRRRWWWFNQEVRNIPVLTSRGGTPVYGLYEDMPQGIGCGYWTLS